MIDSNIIDFRYINNIYKITIESDGTIIQYNIIPQKRYIISFKYNGIEYNNTICKILTIFEQDSIIYLKVDISGKYSSNIIDIYSIYSIEETNYAISAYDIAVDQGFTGTEEEWLETLKGENGDSAYEVAVKNGFNGTVEEWLNSLNALTNISYDTELNVNSTNALTNKVVTLELNKKADRGTTLKDYSISDAVSITDILIINGGNAKNL